MAIFLMVVEFAPNAIFKSIAFVFASPLFFFLFSLLMPDKYLVMLLV
ncbi:hypothetical protein HMPREF1396_00477 [Helicobacter pylori GAM114Ai]|nr:hypothetical protein HMPREF1396_00477 [Helicobacter pylori GAM114Ai]